MEAAKNRIDSAIGPHLLDCSIESGNDNICIRPLATDAEVKRKREQRGICQLNFIGVAYLSTMDRKVVLSDALVLENQIDVPGT